MSVLSHTALWTQLITSSFFDRHTPNGVCPFLMPCRALSMASLMNFSCMIFISTLKIFIRVLSSPRQIQSGASFRYLRQDEQDLHDNFFILYIFYFKSLTFRLTSTLLSPKLSISPIGFPVATAKT